MNSQKATRRALWVLAAVCVVAAGAGAAIALQPRQTQSLASGTLLDKPRAIIDFSLAGADGAAFTNAALIGHWSVIFAGYTYCPDVCPTTLATFRSVENKLGAAGDRVRFVFLSVDPERDTPERLRQYVQYFSPKFEAATGSDTQLQQLGSSLGFVYEKVPGKTPGSYLMDHSAALMLIDPQGHLAGYLTPPFDADAIAADLQQLSARG